MQTKPDWDDYQFFLTIASCGNLQAAAKEMGVNHSTVFRRLNELEARLKVRLFERFKSGYRLTPPGEEIIDRVRQVEEQMHAIERVVHGHDVELSGCLKVSTTDTLGYYWLPPYIRRFKERYPDITVDLTITTRYTNLSKREADIVIPAVNRQPDYMVGKPLTVIVFFLYASTAYLQNHGRPQQTDEFKNHRFILPNETLAGLPASKWIRRYVPEPNIVASSDKLTGLYHLARQGLGLTFLPSYVGQADPELAAVLELPENCRHQAWILTHPDLRYTARVKAFMQFMYKETADAANAVSSSTPAQNQVEE